MRKWLKALLIAPLDGMPNGVEPNNEAKPECLAKGRLLPVCRGCRPFHCAAALNVDPFE